MTHHAFMYGVCQGTLRNLKLRLERGESKEALVDVNTTLGLIQLFQEKSPKTSDECNNLFNEYYSDIRKKAEEM